MSAVFGACAGRGGECPELRTVARAKCRSSPSKRVQTLRAQLYILFLHCIVCQLLPVQRRKPNFSKTMSIALHGWSSAVSSLRINWQQRAAWHVFRPAALLSPLSLGLPSLQSLLELLPPIVWAVPKKKVSHSRKAMRDANKGLKDKTSEILQFTL